MHAQYFKKIFFATAFVALSIGAFFLFHTKTPTVEAQITRPAGNVYGFAWSSTIGWVSMNCNQVGHGGSNNCTDSHAINAVDYGVTLNETTGAMTGYGWSDNVGWVKFDPISPPPYASNIGVGGATVRNITAGGIKPVVGWIRFCSDTNSAHVPDNCGNTSNGVTIDNGGWNGWVTMTGDGGGTRFGVNFNTSSGAFSGFAWGGTTHFGGSEVVGWLNFDMVTAIPDRVPGIPVVKLSAVTPIPQGGDTDITYDLVTAPSAVDPIVACTPFTDGAVGATRDWSTIAINPLPTATPTTKANIWVWAPSTTYYLDCKTQNGVHAADPLNPSVECNRLSPAATCPRTKVVVSSPSRSLLLLGKGPGQAAFNAGPIQIAAGQAVELQWSSPTNTTLTGCEGSSAPYFLPWDTSALSDLNAGNTYKASKAGLMPIAPVTDFNITCFDASSGQFISPLRTVQVQILPPTGNLILEVKPNGAPDTLYTQAPNGSPLVVNPNDAVTLRWSSPQNLTNCKGFSDVGVVNWAIPPGGTNKGNFTAPNQIETGVQTQAPSVTYQVSCMNGALPVTSNTSTVKVDTTPEPIHLSISLDTPIAFNPFGVAVPSNQTTVRLEWWSNTAIANCVGESIANTNWNNSTVVVAGGGSGAAVQRGSITLGSTTAPTTYAIRCGGSISSNSVVATPLVPPTPAVSISGPGCVKNTNVLFELNWWTNLVAPTGSCTLSNSDAFNSDLTAWDTTHSVAFDGDHWVSPLRIDGPTTFYLECTDADGDTLPRVLKNVVVDPLCSDAPQRSWHFQFQEH